MHMARSSKVRRLAPAWAHEAVEACVNARGRYGLRRFTKLNLTDTESARAIFINKGLDGTCS